MRFGMSEGLGVGLCEEGKGEALRELAKGFTAITCTENATKKKKEKNA